MSGQQSQQLIDLTCTVYVMVLGVVWCCLLVVFPVFSSRGRGAALFLQLWLVTVTPAAYCKSAGYLGPDLLFANVGLFHQLCGRCGL